MNVIRLGTKYQCIIESIISEGHKMTAEWSSEYAMKQNIAILIVEYMSLSCGQMSFLLKIIYVKR